MVQNKQRRDFESWIDTMNHESSQTYWMLNEMLSVWQNLDLRDHRLIYDGQLTMKLGETKRFKTIDLHVLLLEDCIMLLQRQDDKYLLKVFIASGFEFVGNGRVTSQILIMNLFLAVFDRDRKIWNIFEMIVITKKWFMICESSNQSSIF